MPKPFADFPVSLLRESSVSWNDRIRELESWIAGLPLADVGETRRLTAGALTLIIETDFLPQEHFKALESFRGAIQYLSDALKRRLSGAAFPLTPASRRIVAQLYGLHSAMAKGYRKIVDELLVLNSHRQDFALLAATAQRALYYLGQELLASYQVYESGPQELWRDIHHIYAAAERKGVHSSPVRDAYRQTDRTTAVEEQYKQLLLLALADPYRYSPPDLALIYALSEQRASRCRIHSHDPLNAAPHTGLVNLEGGGPPVRPAHGAISRHAANRYLDGTALIHALEGPVLQDSDESTGQTPNRRGPLASAPEQQLLQSLLAAWRPAPRRSFSRSQRETADMIEVRLGLDANHQMLNGHIPAGDETMHRCAVINEGAGGLCLKWRAVAAAKIRVGELLAFRGPQQPRDNAWSLAAIRWLRTGSRRAVEFGIQLLSPDAMPVSIRLDNPEAEAPAIKHDYLKGLYIPELKATRQPASLIVPAFLYRANDIVSLRTGRRKHFLRLVKAIDHTPIFSRFQFAPITIVHNPISPPRDRRHTDPIRQRDADNELKRRLLE